MTFPKGFLWGAGASGYQIEGNNVNADWFAWEHTDGAPMAEPAGDACDSYHRYEEDIRLVADLGYGAYRFSIEWPRVEPADDEFSRAELEHYLRMFRACEEHGVTPVATLHHCTMPIWAYVRGGWEWEELPGRFARFCARAAEHFGEHLKWAITINEVDLTTNVGFRLGFWPQPPGGMPPGEAKARLVAERIDQAHRLAHDAVKQAAPHAMVGCSMAIGEFLVRPGGEEALPLAQRLWNGDFWETAKVGDFLGVQSYTSLTLGPRSLPLLRGLADEAPMPDGMEKIMGMTGFMDFEPGVPLSDYGWWINPAGLAGAVRLAHEKVGLPLLITEHGVSTEDDAVRAQFVRDTVPALESVLADGIDLRGYLHWSLLDNFEWNAGYAQHFGLVEVDLDTFERRPKPSAHVLGEIARANGRSIAGAA